MDAKNLTIKDVPRNFMSETGYTLADYSVASPVVHVLFRLPFQSGTLLFENPNGIPSISPRLRRRSYLGFASKTYFTLKGLHPCAAQLMKPRWGFDLFGSFTQGSPLRRPTLG